jgi:hypothetical protein
MSKTLAIVEYKITSKNVLGSCELNIIETRNNQILKLELNGSLRMGFKKNQLNGLSIYEIEDGQEILKENNLKIQGFDIDEENVSRKNTNCDPNTDEVFLIDPIWASVLLINNKDQKLDGRNFLVQFKRKIKKYYVRETPGLTEILSEKKVILRLILDAGHVKVIIKKISLNFKIEKKLRQST